MIDAELQRRYYPVAVRADSRSVTLSPDGRRAYVPAFDGYVSVIDTDPESRTFHQVLPVPGGDAIVVGRGPRGAGFKPVRRAP